MPTFLGVFGKDTKAEIANKVTSCFRVRNLTGLRFQLILIERYKAAVTSGGSGGFFPFSTSTTIPSSPIIAEHASTFTRHELNLELPSFTVTSINIITLALANDETLRFTFLVDGQKYRLDCTPLIDLSQNLQTLTANPLYAFTAIFSSRSSFLVLYRTTQLNSWMQSIHDVAPLSALSIPGTHNSPTCYNALPSVRCQTVSIPTQLANGIRFFDIRIQPESSASARLSLVHSVFPISLTSTKYFHTIEAEIIDFLDHHPSETVLVSLKREGKGNWEGHELAENLYTYHFNPPAPHAARWHISPQIPSIGTVRGKIVLIRRYALPPSQQILNDGAGVGIDASAWDDNSACSTCEGICVQDFYEVLSPSSIDTKFKYITEHFERAGDAIAILPGINTDRYHPIPPQPFFLNFLSASNFWRRGCWPERIAKIINPKVIEWLVEKHHVEGIVEDETSIPNGTGMAMPNHGEKAGDGGAGIVVCDWVGTNGDWDLIRCIIGCNSRFIARSKEFVI